MKTGMKSVLTYILTLGMIGNLAKQTTTGGRIKGGLPQDSGFISRGVMQRRGNRNLMRKRIIKKHRRAA